MSAHITMLPGAAATSRRPAPEAQNSAFVRSVFSLLERTEYRRCDKGEDLEDIYRLRYRAYRIHGVVPANASRMILDDLDDASNVYRFGVYVDQHLVSTLRIHVLDQEHRTGPSTQAFGDIVHPMIDAGDTFIDPSRFAADPEWSKVYPQLPYITLRLAGMACFYFNAPYCLSTIRDDHSAFYKRIYASQKIGEARSYPGVFTPVELYRADVNAIRQRSFERYPFFFSTAWEERLMFGRPELGEPAPLTILPTARYMMKAA